MAPEKVNKTEDQEFTDFINMYLKAQKEYEDTLAEIASLNNKVGDENLTEKEKKLFTIEDIPVYMTGDVGGFSEFREQTDKEAERVLYYNAKDNRHLFDRRSDNSDAEIIIKKEISYDKPIPEEDGKKLYNVLHLYLRALGPRDRSVTTIGIKIPEGVDPSPFMKELAEEVYKRDNDIGALNISQYKYKELGHREFDRRQSELKNIAQELFLKYANGNIEKDSEVKSDTKISESINTKTEWKNTTAFKAFEYGNGKLYSASGENMFLLNNDTMEVTLNAEGFRYGISDFRHYFGQFFDVSAFNPDKYTKFEDLEVKPARVDEQGNTVSKGEIRIIRRNE